MSRSCTHLDHVHTLGMLPSGCGDCLASGRQDRMHLPVCQECGEVGCSDQSPGRQATEQF